MTHWYAAIVRRGREKAACKALTDAGFVAYVPMETVERTTPRRRISRRPLRLAPARIETVEVPIIRGIAIIGSPAELSRDLAVWYGLIQVRYAAKVAPDGRIWQEGEPVIRYLYGNGGVPAIIHEREIGTMLAERDLRVTDLLSGGRPMFEPDESVRILAGAFEGFPATVKELRPGTHRYIVLTSIFGRETPVEIDEAELEKVG